MACFWIALPDRTLAIEHGLIHADSVSAFEDVASLAGALRNILEDQQRVRDEIVDTAMRRAHVVREEAKAEAAALLDAARRDAKELLEQARRQGFEDGQATAAAQWHERRLRDAQLEHERLSLQQHQIARIACAAVERMVAVESASALYAKALSQVGDLLKGCVGAVLRVHPGRVESARAALAACAAGREELGVVEVVGDTALSTGGCRFESDLGCLDASLEVQLGALQAAFAATAPVPARRDDPTTEPQGDAFVPPAKSEHVA